MSFRTQAQQLAIDSDDTSPLLKLFQQSKPIIHSIAKRYCNLDRSYEIEDLEQIGFLASERPLRNGIFPVATPNSKPSSIAISRKHTKANLMAGTNWSKSQIKTTNTSRRCPIPHSSKKSGAYTARALKVASSEGLFLWQLTNRPSPLTPRLNPWDCPIYPTPMRCWHSRPSIGSSSSLANAPGRFRSQPPSITTC